MLPHMPPLTPVVLEQIAEAKRLTQVLEAQWAALARGESPQHHLAMIDSLVTRIQERSRAARMNVQMVQGAADLKHREESWIYQAPK